LRYLAQTESCHVENDGYLKDKRNSCDGNSWKLIFLQLTYRDDEKKRFILGKMYIFDTNQTRNFHGESQELWQRRNVTMH
jgi:hypothetical protein